MAQFHQFTPLELYNIAAEKTGRRVENPQTKEFEDCPQLLFLFAKSLYERGMRSLRLHAQNLGIPPIELRHAVKPLTGMMYTEFTEDFIEIMIKDIVGRSLAWGEVEKKAERLGFSPSGLYRFMMRRMKRTPSGRRWYM